MMPPTHIIDRDGKVMIILRNPNLPFAEMIEEGKSTGSNIEQQTSVKQRKLTVEKKENDVTPKLSPRQKHEPAPDQAPANESPPNDDSADDSSEKSTEESMDEECFRIQASAEHLISASPFFKNMLSGGWEESTHYLQKGSVEIVAEGWDMEALLILLHVVHGHFDQVPQELTLEMLAKIAVIADYYMCKECLGAEKTRWMDDLKTRIVRQSRRDLALWIWIAWFFKSPELFKRFTSHAMSMYKDTFTSLGLPIPDRVIGNKSSFLSGAFYTNQRTVAINKGREDALDHSITRLNQARLAFLNGTEGCDLERHSSMYEYLTSQMQHYKLISPIPVAPFSRMSYYGTMMKIKSLITPRRGPFGHDPQYGSFHRCPQSLSVTKISVLKSFLKGLELKDYTFDGTRSM
ncbi:hypothetical protein N7466_003278 [Penicillium verhagenii]|uniref:uncharacterized protein n=1 Tax=Penicillium verhagenii TaxID=1562060 RepID=UPI0025453E7B|nr:uncharacterized protein N7466_003278 [Penicillium verhagenii]KAJ5936828.1 hypothetical protein N7466_003278 [Penicillium verhagenii]